MRDFYRALCARVHEDGDKIAFKDFHSALSYRTLMRRSKSLAAELSKYPKTIALMSKNDINWPIAQIAGLIAGKTLVPIPSFFSAHQVRHIIDDAGVDVLMIGKDYEGLASDFCLPVINLGNDDKEIDIEFQDGFQQIIYTSGSTGRPKGVRLGARQIEWSVSALATASQARASDRHLSLLPLAILLETLSAIFVPLHVGGTTILNCLQDRAQDRTSATTFSQMFAAYAPSTAVLVPQLLQLWTHELITHDSMAPASLRFVAVGGAPTPTNLIKAAWRRGIPVYQGYGLSECCSVVALNRPGASKMDSVGQSLPGLKITLESDEIVVDGPSVMLGYLGEPEIAGKWRTGDLGQIDAEGFIKIVGRKDNLIVLSSGRNISPEWVESMLQNDPKIVQCAVFSHGQKGLSVLIIPSDSGEEWFERSCEEDVLGAIKDICSELPQYAIPQHFVVMKQEKLLASDLLTPNGRFQRRKLTQYFQQNT